MAVSKPVWSSRPQADATMLRQRVITALVLLALLLPALWVASPLPFALLSLGLISAAGWEWARLNGVDSSAVALVTGGLLALLCAVSLSNLVQVGQTAGLWWLATACWLFGGGSALAAASAQSSGATTTARRDARVRRRPAPPASAARGGAAARARFGGWHARVFRSDVQEGDSWRVGSGFEGFVRGAAALEDLRERGAGAEDIGFHFGQGDT